MSYAHVVAGVVQQVGQIPSSWHLTTGGSVSGFDLLPNLWAAEGWLPVVEVHHPFDSAVEQESPAVFTVGATEVSADYPVVPRPAAEINADLIRAKGTQAITTNTAYLATLPAVATKITAARATLATGKAQATAGKAAVVTTVAQAQTQTRATWTVVEGLCSILDDTLSGLGDAVAQTGVLAQEATAVLRLVLSALDSTTGT